MWFENWIQFWNWRSELVFWKTEWTRRIIADELTERETERERENEASICNNACIDSLVRARLTEMIALKCEISQLNEWNDCLCILHLLRVYLCFSLPFRSRLFLHQIPFIFILSVLFELIKFKRCREKKIQ